MQGLWRMNGLEHHKTDRLGAAVQVAQCALGPNELLKHKDIGDQYMTYPASVHVDQYQQQIIVSRGFIQAIQTGDRLNRIKSKTL